MMKIIRITNKKNWAFMNTQVVIIGGGPAGLLLSHILMGAGISTIVLERQTREYVLKRIRAGILEYESTKLLRHYGLGKNLDAEGKQHHGFSISNEDKTTRIDLANYTGKHVTLYGQTALTRDLYNAQIQSGANIIHEITQLHIDNLKDGKTTVSFVNKNGKNKLVEADFVVGCDGSRSVSKTFIPKGKTITYQRNFNFQWLGILSETTPVSSELIYSYHKNGFALASQRNQTLSRYYVQAPIKAKIEDWSDNRFWKELRKRLPSKIGDNLVVGKSIEKSLTRLRSSVTEPMQYGNLFLAGDSAHIVPPTGAKGLNLAFSDVFYLSRALKKFYQHNQRVDLDNYSKIALERIWRVVKFSCWMTEILHASDETNHFEKKINQAELTQLLTSERTQASLAENYVGLPY